MAGEADLLLRPLLRHQRRHQLRLVPREVGQVKRPGVIAAEAGPRSIERDLRAPACVGQRERDEPAGETAAHDHMVGREFCWLAFHRGSLAERTSALNGYANAVVDRRPAKIEDVTELPGDEQSVGELAEWTERQLVLDAVANQRSARRIRERVRMPPAAVGALRLHIHEPRFRRERLDERAPAEPQAEERELVVDGRAGAHRDRLRAADLEVQRFRRDALEVGRVGEEGEHLRSGPVG